MGEIKLADGCCMAFTDEGQGPVLILLHGLAMSGAAFVDVSQALRAEFRVIVPDLRGHGQSDAGREQSIHRLGEDLSEMIEQLDLRDVILVGWSMGAMMAWSYLRSHEPDRVAGLVSIDMSPRITNDSDWSLGVLDGRDQAGMVETARSMASDWPGIAKRFAPRLFARGRQSEEADLVAKALSWAEANDSSVMANYWRSMSDADFREDLVDCQLPVLIIFGLRSSLYGPYTSEFIHRTLPHSELLPFELSGHAPHLEEPLRFNEALKAFANRIHSSQEKATSLKTG